jgi:hypothetical protein
MELLDARRPALRRDARGPGRAATWEDLKKNPENGWTLLGLLQALKAQGKKEEAALVEERFKKAWKDADVNLTASRIGT